MALSTSSISRRPELDPLRRELDGWSSAGVAARIWWRDDDAVESTPALNRLLDLAGAANVTVALAAIPERIQPSLMDVAAPAGCPIWQHGWGHHFHDDGEFGDKRPLAGMIEDAWRGQERLDQVLGPSGWQRVFVPPNHQLSMVFKSMTPGLGYRAVSAGVPLTAPIDGVVEVNAELDIMDWPAGRALPLAELCGQMASALRRRRTGEEPIDLPIGMLTHHLALNDDDWACLGTLVEGLVSHPAVSFLRADQLCASPARKPRIQPPPRVTVVVTSCGRQDLLVRTLDSLIEHNTYPQCEFVIIEDGDGAANREIARRYQGPMFRWIETGGRIGQVAAIDMAYAAVESEYIFHCEDDWEFLASGFIEKSLTVLERNRSILQIWLRALDDTNDHPLLRPVLYADDVPYRLLEPEHTSADWGSWHGFSWNPGLRRRRDYELIRPFAALDHARTGKSYEVEREAGIFYQRRGLFAAILADNDGKGYVRHLGWGRRVRELNVTGQ